MQYFQKMAQILIILRKQIDQELFQKYINLRKEKTKEFLGLIMKFQIMEKLSNIAGTKPINALIKAVKTKETIISLIFIGAINKFVKFLLQISSKNNILKPILVLNKKS